MPIERTGRGELLTREQRMGIASSEIAKYAEILGPKFQSMSLEIDKVVSRAAAKGTPAEIKESVRRQMDARRKGGNVKK